MLVAIDKSRRNHKPFGIDGFLACNLVFSDDSDPAVLYADISDSVIIRPPFPKIILPQKKYDFRSCPQLKYGMKTKIETVINR